MLFRRKPSRRPFTRFPVQPLIKKQGGKISSQYLYPAALHKSRWPPFRLSKSSNDDLFHPECIPIRLLFCGKHVRKKDNEEREDALAVSRFTSSTAGAGTAAAVRIWETCRPLPSSQSCPRNRAMVLFVQQESPGRYDNIVQ